MILEITYNTNKDGIELRFDEKPDSELTRFLSYMGCKYSVPQQMWYAADNKQRRDVFQALQQILQNNQSLDKINIYPSFQSTEGNINQRQFSLATITLQHNEQTTEDKQYILFEPSKRTAELICKGFAQKTFGSSVKRIHIQPRSGKRKARVLLQTGQIIQSSHDNKQTLSQPVSDDLQKNVAPTDNKADTLDQVILDELYANNKVDKLDRSLLIDLGLQTPLNSWKISIGPYLLTRTSTFRYQYQLSKLPPQLLL